MHDYAVAYRATLFAPNRDDRGVTPGEGQKR